MPGIRQLKEDFQPSSTEEGDGELQCPYLARRLADSYRYLGNRGSDADDHRLLQTPEIHQENRTGDEWDGVI